MRTNSKHTRSMHTIFPGQAVIIGRSNTTAQSLSVSSSLAIPHFSSQTLPCHNEKDLTFCFVHEPEHTKTYFTGHPPRTSFSWTLGHKQDFAVPQFASQAPTSNLLSTHSEMRPSAAITIHRKMSLLTLCEGDNLNFDECRFSGRASE